MPPTSSEATAVTYPAPPTGATLDPGQTEAQMQREMAGLDALELAGSPRGELLSRVWLATWSKVAAVAISLLLWQLVVWSGWKPEFVLPGPIPVFEELWNGLTDGQLLKATFITVQRAVIGYAIALLIGVAIGGAVSQSQILRSAIGSMITGLQTMPSIAWFPLAILLFKLSEQAILFVILMGAAPAIANGLISGTDNIQPVLVRAGRVLGGTRVRALPPCDPARVDAVVRRWDEAGLGVCLALAPRWRAAGGDHFAALDRLQAPGRTGPVRRRVAPGHHDRDPVHRHRRRLAGLRPTRANHPPTVGPDRLRHDVTESMPSDRSPRIGASRRSELPSGPMSRPLIRDAESALLDERRRLTADELTALAGLPDEIVPALTALAHQVRLDWCGPEVEVEGILSVKTGGCPEDCHFCSQSSAYDTPVKAAPFMDTDEVLAAARETAELGASEFCIVLAVKGPDEKTMQRILELVPIVRDETGLNLAVSAGILDADQAKRLAEGGVHRYNHNLESSRSFFPRVATTHSWEDRWNTCELVKANGMELCCGVLLGMGESTEQRLELIGQLVELDPTEVPINFLNPRPGTPLQIRKPVSAMEALRWIALFRLALPSVILRYAGGREITLRELQVMGMTAGINALIVGNYLTTLGRAPDEDLQMLDDLQMPIAALTGVV